MKKKLVCMCLVVLATLTGCGCNNKNEEDNIYQNDFYGSIMRETNIISDVGTVLEDIKAKNESVKDENPTDFWNSSDFAYLSTRLVDDTYLEKLYLLGEYDEWDVVKENVTSLYADDIENGVVNDFDIEKKSDNNYVITFTTDEEDFDWAIDKNGYEHEIDVTYDATHDWAQMCEYVTFNNKKVLIHFYEYGRYKNTYVIQTDKERLVVNYKNVYDENEEVVTNKDGSSTTTTTAVLVGKEIDSFYFTQLNGKNFKRNVFSYENIEDNADSYGFVAGSITRDFELTNAYGLTDTIFTDISEISSDFVTEKGSYARQLVYKKGVLNARIYNSLAKQIEVFDFSKKGKCKHTFEPVDDGIVKIYYEEHTELDEYEDEIVVGGFYLSSGEELSSLGTGDNLIIEYDGTFYNVTEKEYNTDGSLSCVYIDTNDEASQSLVDELKEKEAKEKAKLTQSTLPSTAVFDSSEEDLDNGNEESEESIDDNIN